MLQVLRLDHQALGKTILALTLVIGMSLSSCTTEMVSLNGHQIQQPTSGQAPAQIDPIVINGKKYGGGYNQGALPIWDAESGKKIKNVTIYSYPPEKPAVFFKSMKLVNNNQDILIENEMGERFLFNLKTEKVRPGKSNKVKGS